MKDNLIGESTTALVKQASSGEIALWTDEKKKDFCKTFNDRSRVARYLLIQTGMKILDTAQRRQFIGSKHKSSIEIPSVPYDSRASYYDAQGVGGRPVNDLNTIASERAELVLKELPPLKKAVMVIDPVTAGKIERKEKILEELRKLKEGLESEELVGPIKMDEVDPKISVGDFMKMVKDRVKKRKAIFSRMDDLAIEGQDLEEYINKKLYKGLPGLSDAVISVAQRHFDRAIALDEMDRRVQERVMFGDSQTALEMLKNFEKDEQTIPDEVRAEFQKALEKLKVSKKQLGRGKK